MSVSSREIELCRYAYDPLDRQTDCMLVSLPAILRFHCKSRLATEIQGALQTSVFQQNDQLLAQRRQQDGEVDTTLLVTDQQRSVLGARGLSGSHLLAYTPYGHRPRESGLLGFLGFNGERLDPVTGHYHLGNGYRQFNPVLMRFNSPDSWSPFGEGGLNAYAYCNGEPVLGSDPTGHSNIFRSLWKGLKNMLGRTPSKLRKPTTGTGTKPVGTSNATPLELAKDFNLNQLTEAERHLNYKISNTEQLQRIKDIQTEANRTQFFRDYPNATRLNRTKSLDLSANFSEAPSPNKRIENLLNSPENNPQNSRLLLNLAKDKDDRYLKYLAASRSEFSYPPNANTRKVVSSGIQNSILRQGL